MFSLSKPAKYKHNHTRFHPSSQR